IPHFDGGIIACPPTAMTEEGFEEFLRERRERTERTRHLLVSVLAITCIALAVSNVVLALRLTSGRARQSAEPPARATSVPQAAAHAARRAPARDDARAIGAARTDRRAGARSARGSHRRVDADDVWARRRRGARAGRARVLRREVGRRPILASGTRSHRHRTL